MREVAMIARTFYLDPAALLDDSGDEFNHLVRVAAATYAVEQEQAEQQRAERQAQTKRGR